MEVETLVDDDYPNIENNGGEFRLAMQDALDLSDEPWWVRLAAFGAFIAVMICGAIALPFVVVGSFISRKLHKEQNSVR
jgi:hypothetical protein